LEISNMTIKITKQLATMEDLAIGTGTVVQERNGIPLTLNKIDFNSRVIRATSVAEIGAYSAPVGYVFSLNAGGRSGDFDVVAGDFSTELAADTLNGVYIGQADNPTATTKVARRRSEENVNVKWFGATGDGSDQTSFFNAAAAYAKSKSVDYQSNKGPVIDVFGGLFLISSQITNKANWHLYPNAIINGLPKVAPTGEDDTTYLTGRVFNYSGIDQSRAVRIGDPSFKTQEVTGKGHTGELTAISANGTTGLAGLSYTVPGGYGQGCIGVEGIVIADEGDDVNTVYGFYSEMYRAPGNTKNAIGMEIGTFNFGDTLVRNPYQITGPGGGITMNLNLTTGANSTDTPWGTVSNDVTCAIYLLGIQGSRFEKGIIITANSIRSNIAMALGLDHRISWMEAGDREAGYVARDSHRLEAENAVFVTHVRHPTDVSQSPVGYATQGLISYQQFMSRSPGNVDYEVASIKVYQQREFVNGETEGRLDINVNFYDGRTQKYEFLPFRFTADDNLASCGSPGRRWTEIYAAAGTISTSDERDKTEITSIDERELLVAQACKSLIKKFKFKDAVAKKGDSARWHFGVIAQEVIEAFESQNLDAMKYGCVCYDEWETDYNEDGEVTQEAGNRYGVRYDELCMFILASI